MPRQATSGGRHDSISQRSIDAERRRAAEDRGDDKEEGRRPSIRRWLFLAVPILGPLACTVPPASPTAEAPTSTSAPAGAVRELPSPSSTARPSTATPPSTPSASATPASSIRPLSPSGPRSSPSCPQRRERPALPCGCRLPSPTACFWRRCGSEPGRPATGGCASSTLPPAMRSTPAARALTCGSKCASGAPSIARRRACASLPSG